MKCIGAICPHYQMRRTFVGEWFELCENSDEVIDDDYECPIVKEGNNE